MTVSRGSGAESSERLIVAVRALASARSMDDIVEVVRHAARELVDADGATFVLRDDENCFYVDEDAIEPLWRGQRFPLSACISGWAMLHAEAVAIPDIYEDDRIPHEAYRPTFVRSLVMTPVRSDDPVAAIGTYWAANHEATPYELELLQALADSTAVAIESVRVLGELEERVHARTAELAAANRDLRAFANLAAHDLRNPLLTAAAYIDIAAKIEGDRLSADARDALEGAQSTHQHMARLIEAILEYSTVAASDVARDPVDMRAVVDNVLLDLQALADDRQARVEVGELPKVLGSEVLLERVMQNLIANAIAYGDPAQPYVGIWGGIDATGAPFVEVTDNGQGVPERERDRIFDMFTRGSSGRDSDGFGIGLAFAARVMEKHGGAISVSDGPDGGAAFRITLPERLHS